MIMILASSPPNQAMENNPNTQACPNNNNNNSNNNQLPPLQCPRCNSSNTKFCYYNNYSLSQPRHFCKACKRYWTRGGTLRNVPVGGGCRKNKRIKRPPPPTTAAASTANPKTDLQSQATNPLFYGLNPLEPINFPFSSFTSSTRVSDNNNTGFAFQPEMNGLGLGFSSGLMSNGSFSSSGLYGSSTMASLLASTNYGNHFKNMLSQAAANGGSGLLPYEEMQMGNIKDDDDDDVKVEGDHQNRLGSWSLNPDPNPNPVQQMNYNSDPTSSSLIWNPTNIDSWFDPSNSVPSLI